MLEWAFSRILCDSLEQKWSKIYWSFRKKQTDFQCLGWFDFFPCLFIVQWTDITSIRKVGVTLLQTLLDSINRTQFHKFKSKYFSQNKNAILSIKEMVLVFWTIHICLAIRSIWLNKFISSSIYISIYLSI